MNEELLAPDVREAFERIALPNFHAPAQGLIEDHWQTWQEAWEAAVAAERERCAKEAEHWQTISTTPGHACGQYIAAAIRKGRA